jgi:CXCXC repeat
MSVEENGYRNGENGEVSSREDSTAEHSFDDLTRGLATGTVSRRKALGVVLASLFGGAFAFVPGMAMANHGPKHGGTGCPKAGQIRENGKCVCPAGTTECRNGCVNEVCSGGRIFNANTCQCECETNQVFCGGTCQPECPGGKVRDPLTCACTCASTEVECGGRCLDPTCSGGRALDLDTCTCECPEATDVFCGGNCVQGCVEGQVLNRNCQCVDEVTCEDVCEGCCDGGQCKGGSSDTACGTAGLPCRDCAALGQVCVNGLCQEPQLPPPPPPPPPPPSPPPPPTGGCTNNASCGNPDLKCENGVCVPKK